MRPVVKLLWPLIILCYHVYNSRASKRRSWKQILWWLEVQVFVVEAEHLVDQDRIEALYQTRQTLEQDRSLVWIIITINSISINWTIILGAPLIMPKDLCTDQLMVYLAKLGKSPLEILLYSNNKYQVYSDFTIWLRNLPATQIKSVIPWLCNKPIIYEII